MTQLKALERSTVYVTYTSLRVLGMDCGRMYRGATRLQPRQSVGPAGGQMLRYPLARETDIVAHLTRFCLLSLSLSLCVCLSQRVYTCKSSHNGGRVWQLRPSPSQIWRHLSLSQSYCQRTNPGDGPAAANSASLWSAELPSAIVAHSSFPALASMMPEETR